MCMSVVCGRDVVCLVPGNQRSRVPMMSSVVPFIELAGSLVIVSPTPSDHSMYGFLPARCVLSCVNHRLPFSLHSTYHEPDDHLHMIDNGEFSVSNMTTPPANFCFIRTE